LAAEDLDEGGIVVGGVIDALDVDTVWDLVCTVRSSDGCYRVFASLDKGGCEVFAD
jgi:hypothetical protein